jgi:hypothetical protein
VVPSIPTLHSRPVGVVPGPGGPGMGLCSPHLRMPPRPTRALQTEIKAPRACHRSTERNQQAGLAAVGRIPSQIRPKTSQPCRERQVELLLVLGWSQTLRPQNIPIDCPRESANPIPPDEQVISSTRPLYSTGILAFLRPCGGIELARAN